VDSTKDYIITDADSRSGEVTIIVEGEPRRIAVAELDAASVQPDAELAAIYRTMVERAQAALRADRKARVARCARHVAVSTVERGSCGTAYGADENRAAHGNIAEIETCDCGAVRTTNINGSHREQGRWR